MKNYVDLANTIQSAQIASANLGIVGYVDNAVSTANIGIIGYINLANTIQSNQISAANLGMKGYVDSVASQSIYGNSNVASFLPTYSGNLTADSVDFNFLTVSNGSTGINTLSVGVPGISPFGNAIASFHGNINAPSHINVHNKNSGDSSLSGFVATAYSSTDPEAYNATLQVTGEGWNVPAIDLVKPYDAIVGSIGGNLVILAHDKDFSAPSKDIVLALGYNPTYEKVRVSNSSVTITGANLQVGNVTATYFTGSGAFLTALPGYVYSNVNVKAYAESMGYQNYGNVNVAAYVTTANSAVVGYVDNAVFTANIGIIGYINLANTIQSSQITAANLGIYTMGNVTHWTSNVSTISAALDQLASRIYDIENP
jgi:hypothetical protein